MQILGPKRLNRALGRNLLDKGGAIDLFSSAPLDLRFALQKTLDPRVTFTRASSGTYVGSDGLIKSAVTNLLTYSEQFDNAAWTKTNSTVTTNATTAPNGTLTADKLITNNTASSGRASVSVTAAVTGSPATLSCFAKQGETSVFGLFISDGVTGRAADFDLITGTVSGTPTAGMTASIEAVGDGWYRCVATVASITGTTRSLRVVQTVVANDGIKGLYIWGAQFEETSTVGEYIPTVAAINSAPRFDHNLTTGESLGLLVEEARTNLSLYSEDFTDASWTKTDCTITANESTAPDGTTTADLWTNIPSAGGVINNSITKDATTRTYTVTMWVKGTVSLFTFTLDFGGTTNRGRAQFNLATNTVVGTTNTGNFTGTSASITAYPGGWARLTMTTTTSTGTTIRFRPFFGTGGESVYIWGAQVEEGAFPTSYIPTTTATATRAADVASITGTAFSSFYNQTEGTVFVETQLQSTSARNAAGFDINDNSTNNRSIFRAFTTGSFDQYLVRSGSSTVVTIASATAPTLVTRKSIIAYKINDFAITADRLAPNLDTSGAVPVAVTQMFIGSAQAGAEFMGGTIKRLTYWPVRLATPTLQAITQP